ncbi:hypothetical protein [Formosa sp. S-31]|uniref:hypothetical protein n=1 Tax=Formosa sp. S-31 TaxID=2790949 RepID=UPI003EBFAEE7
MKFENVETIDFSKPLDFGTIFNQSLELFKKTWLQGVITNLLTLAIIFPFYLIIYLPFMAFGIIDPEAFRDNPDSNPLMLIPVGALFLIFSVVISVIALALKSAFYRICRQKDLGIEGADDYFYYFKKTYLIKLLKLSVVTMVISLLATMLCFLPIIYVIVPLSFFNVIFAFNPEWTELEITKASFKLGNAKWLITFGLMIICGLLAQLVGMMMCLVGVFLTASFAYLPAYFIYKEMFGFDEFQEEEDLKILEA